MIISTQQIKSEVLNYKNNIYQKKWEDKLVGIFEKK